MDTSAQGASGSTCAECGAHLPEGTSCRDIFERMLALEFQHFESFGAVHHLTVLCYNVQHPGPFTDELWDYTASLLTEVVEREIPAADLRKRMGRELAARSRRMKINGAPKQVRRYAWTMRAGDVLADDPRRYVARVREWARSIVTALQSG